MSKGRPKWYAIFAGAVLAGAGLFAGLLARQKNDETRAEYQNGTTRRPAWWNGELAGLEDCANKYVAELPDSPALMREPIVAPVDSLARGGIFRFAKLSDDTITHVPKGSTAESGAIYRRGARQFFVSDHAAVNRPMIAHELAHALSDYYPALRNPPGIAAAAADSLGDHGGPFFRRCVAHRPNG